MTLKIEADLETLALDPSVTTRPLDQIGASQSLWILLGHWL